MHRVLLILLVLTWGISADAAADGCRGLPDLALRDITVRNVEQVPTGELTVPGLDKPLQVDEFCRVTAVATPTSDSDIHFEVWIPPKERWNGKLLGTGNGGFAGSISYRALAGALERGYAAVSSDTGHTGDQMEFGQGHPEKIIDWAYRAVHVTTRAAQEIIRSYAGRSPVHSYFQGCSTGGQQALSEAQRFPEDYDGIIAGAPGNDRVRLILGFLWSWIATHDTGGRPLLGQAQLSLLTREVTARCDAADGLQDGLISDPRRCKFDPVVLECRATSPRATGVSGAGGVRGAGGLPGAGEPVSCLTPEQVAAVRKVYAGARNPRTGAQLFPGWMAGSEEGWGSYIVGPKEPVRLGLFRYFAFHDRTWDWRAFDWDHDVRRVETQVPYLSAVSSDLREFRSRGGRLLMYTGWADSVVPPLDVVSYYETVARGSGGFENAGKFFRFFAVPGMGHCGGGPGLNTLDALASLEDWVERGRAPDRLIVSRVVDGHVQRSRPVCAYPTQAQYGGRGSIDASESFTCTRGTGHSLSGSSKSYR